MNARQIRKRLVQMVIVLIGISFFTFILTYLSPGDPVTAMYSASGSMPSEAVLEATREELDLNDPFLVQYWNWLTGCLRGDFGTSYSMHKPVLQRLSSRLMPTLKLAFASLLIMLIFSVPLGMLSAVYKGKPIDYLVRGITFFGVSMPNFWVGMLLLYLFAIQLKLLPVVSSGQGFKKIILPALTLAFAMMGKYTRQVRTAVLEELNQDYVIGARARGIKESTILWRHVFPNALLPLVTMLGLSLGSLLGGTAVVEVIFSYQGLGNLAVTSISARDYPMIQGYVLWIALIYMGINLIVDISYDYLDPRIRESQKTPTGRRKAKAPMTVSAAGWKRPLASLGGYLARRAKMPPGEGRSCRRCKFASRTATLENASGTENKVSSGSADSSLPHITDAASGAGTGSEGR